MLTLANYRRYWAKVDTSEPEGCWPWTAGTIKGYGSWRAQSVHYYAHRVSYEVLIGPIPDGLDIDHLCRNTLCCNPYHMEPVTRAENRRRAPISGMAQIHATKTRCVNGHLLSGNNLITTTRQRVCRECRNASHRRWQEKRHCRPEEGVGDT